METIEQRRNRLAKQRRRNNRAENVVTGVGCFVITIYAIVVLAFWALVVYGIWEGIQYLQRH